MINITGTLNDGRTFEQYHRDTMSMINGQDYTKDSVLDRLYRAIDMVEFTKLKNWQEIGLAKDINYAHGLELDDIGDNIGLERNGLSDIKYRFLLKLRNMSLNSSGTMYDLLNICSTVLGCSNDDIHMSEGYEYDKNHNLIGENNVINIDQINIENVNNPELIDGLADELQKATAGSTRINSIGFYNSIPFSLYAGTGLSIAESFSIEIPNYQEISRTISQSMTIGTGLVMTEKLSIDQTNSK